MESRSNQNIVVLTGAGISAESGIPTFRASDGLWHNHRIEDVASPQGFKKNPARVHQFYNERREHLLSAAIKSNLAHYALSKLEQQHKGNVLVITQNIDDLQERAGSKKLVHMHGELLKKRCIACGSVTEHLKSLSTMDVCDECGSSGNLRPHIVWFGEMPLQMELIERSLLAADLFVSIGTSGNVYPAANFFEIAARAGARTLEINLEATGSNFHAVRCGKATEVVPQWVDELLGDATM